MREAGCDGGKFMNGDAGAYRRWCGVWTRVRMRTRRLGAQYDPRAHAASRALREERGGTASGVRPESCRRRPHKQQRPSGRALPPASVGGDAAKSSLSATQLTTVVQAPRSACRC